MSDAERPVALRDVALLFLRLGATAFGGPAAHIAMMEDEVVRRRQWLTRDEFLDLLGATNLIPGPNSTEVAIHIGHRRAGWSGLVVAGLAFILPAFAIVTVLAHLYVRYERLPEAAWLLYGVKPVVIAVVVQALWELGRAALKTRALVVLAVIAFVASLAGVNELLLLAGAAGVAVAMSGYGRRRVGLLVPATRLSDMSGAGPALQTVGAVAVASKSFGLWPLFLAFAKIGAVLFGSGYVLLAFLRADFVERFGWLTESQLLDAIAIGQVTPGPVFTTATFIGYLLGGFSGSIVATVGIFLPAFVFVAISGPLVPRLRRSPAAAAVLDAVNAASLALMAAVTCALARSALVDAPTIVLAALGALLLVRWRVNSAWLVAGGAFMGWVLHVAGR